MVEDLAGLVMQRYNSPGFFFKDYGQLGPEISLILENIKDVPLETDIAASEKPGFLPELKPDEGDKM